MVFRITGKLHQKSLLSTGEKQDGYKWRAINFVIVKTENKEQTFYAFTTYNNNADYIDGLELKTRITIGFHPKTKYVVDRNYWATTLIASEIDLYVKPSKLDNDSGGDLPQQTNLQLGQ